MTKLILSSWHSPVMRIVNGTASHISSKKRSPATPLSAHHLSQHLPRPLLPFYCPLIRNRRRKAWHNLPAAYVPLSPKRRTPPTHVAGGGYGGRRVPSSAPCSPCHRRHHATRLGIHPFVRFRANPAITADHHLRSRFCGATKIIITR